MNLKDYSIYLPEINKIIYPIRYTTSTFISKIYYLGYYQFPTGNYNWYGWLTSNRFSGVPEAFKGKEVEINLFSEDLLELPDINAD